MESTLHNWQQEEEERGGRRMDSMLVSLIIGMNADVTILRASVRTISNSISQSTKQYNTIHDSAVQFGERKLKKRTIRDNMEQCRNREWSGMECAVVEKHNTQHHNK